jgi:hypothetical protein
VTQRLHDLKPFVFPALPKEPPQPAAPRNGSSKSHRDTVKDPLPSKPAYPCRDCASTIPYFYCDPCKSEWNKRIQAEYDRAAAKQRDWYARRKARRVAKLPPKICQACGAEFKGKRTDARFCSDKCRQKAHRTPVTAKTKFRTRIVKSRDSKNASRQVRR